ncbi:uncharacterized protein K02A2.6-like [Alosa sapidissima]|uniref:uncharacterized protein K02A2.6-like n=1 Tax=Alosa sapidissima TaxID=34773 RepID=UPI001C0A53BF|nr:uncharacterized protein K02A2.6-like [Alosa sapidissima]
MVTTVTESFFRQHVQSQTNETMQPCDWLQLKAANGLAIPYLGYIELDLEVLGKVLPKIGVLVVTDALDPTTRQQKTTVPGLLGMNAISRCYQELFEEHGQDLFHCPLIQTAESGWKRALSECQILERLSSSGCIGKAVVQPGPALRIPAGCLKFVHATCSLVPGPVTSCFLEPLPYGEGRLPSNLLISSALLPITQGKVNVPVVNVGTEDQWLQPRITLGTLHIVDPTPCNDQVVSAQSAAASTSASVDFLGLQWPNLSSSQQQEARELLEKYRGVFSEHDGDLGCTVLIQHEIPLVDTAPVRQRYRRLPPSQFAQVKAHVQELVEQGVARPSSSPYASPIVVVQKKDGAIRLCVDYRQLNARTRKDAYPLPRIEESLDALTGATLFSTLDLASGYNQVPMAERDKEKTAFCTPFGLFEFNRMPFGLCNAPSTFQRLMERIFGDQSFQSLLLYLDDIVIFSSSFHQHVQRLQLVLSRLKEHNLKLKLSKCNFFKEEVQYLGHVISASGVATDPGKIQTVLQWKQPTTLTHLRSFLGFASYYRRFVAGFAKHAGVLELVRQWRRIREQEGILYREIQLPPARDFTLQLLLPKLLHREVLVSLHDNHGHQGVERTTELIRQRCYWPKMRQAIEQWCKQCERCTLAKGVVPTARSYSGHLLAAKPLEVLAIDFTCMEKASNGYENVLIVTDVFSKFTQAYPTINQQAETVAKVLTEKWFYSFGVPKRIHSDQVGTRVYRRNHPIGRHKIQDLWDPRIYRVVKCRDEKGLVYHLTPEDGLGPDMNAHRSEFKALPVQDEPHADIPVDIPGDSTKEKGRPETIEPDENEVWFQVLPHQPFRRPIGEMRQEDSAIQQLSSPSPSEEDTQGQDTQGDQAAPMTTVGGTSPSLEVESESAEDAMAVREDTPNRPRRARAGQHSNPFRLPQSAVQHLEGQQYAIQSVNFNSSYYFRPWH